MNRSPFTGGYQPFAGQQQQQQHSPFPFQNQGQGYFTGLTQHHPAAQQQQQMQQPQQRVKRSKSATRRAKKAQRLADDTTGDFQPDLATSPFAPGASDVQIDWPDEDLVGDNPEDAKAVAVTMQIACFDAQIASLVPLAKAGNVEAKGNLLNYRAKRMAALEQRRRMLPPSEQVKTLTRARKTRQIALEKAECALASAKAILEERESDLRSCQQEFDKISLELAQIEYLREPSTPNLVIDESNADLLSSLKSTLSSPGCTGVSWTNMDPKQREALQLVLSQAEAFSNSKKTAAASTGAMAASAAPASSIAAPMLGTAAVPPRKNVGDAGQLRQQVSAPVTPQRPAPGSPQGMVCATGPPS